MTLLVALNTIDNIDICYLLNLIWPPLFHSQLTHIWNFTLRLVSLIPEAEKRLINYNHRRPPAPRTLALYLVFIAPASPPKKTKKPLLHTKKCVCHVYIMKTTVTHFWTNANQIDSISRTVLQASLACFIIG